MQPLSLDKFGEPLHPFPAITPSVCNLRPDLARPRAHPRTDPVAAPEIRLNYLSTPEDQAGCRARHALHAPHHGGAGAGEVRARGVAPGRRRSTDDGALVKAAGDLGTTIFHPVGTCRMGHDDRARWWTIACVCTASTGLRVIDASVMPRITSGNTNAPTYMIAERGAEFVLSESK